MFTNSFITILNEKANVVKGTVPRGLRCSINYKPLCFIPTRRTFSLFPSVWFTVYYNSVNAIVPVSKTIYTESFDLIYTV
jgi:hypothetical protein